MKIYLDIDGTLADMMGHAARAHGLTMPEAWPPGEYDLQVALGHKGTRQEFWRHLDGPDFWATMPWLPDGQQIVRHAENYFPQEDIYLLTSPTIDPFCAAGKTMWVQKHLPAYKRRLMIGPCKECCAQPDAILIDDSDDKIRKFRQHGGFTVLVPRPWNSRHSDSDRAENVVRLALKAASRGCPVSV